LLREQDQIALIQRLQQRYRSVLQLLVADSVAAQVGVEPVVERVALVDRIGAWLKAMIV
jgi:hypothetical protein